MKVTPETIRKIYVLIGAIVGALAFIPDSIKIWFSESGIDVVMGVITAIFAVIQFLPSRTGESDKPAELKTGGAKASYWLPWTKP